jgi:lipopolysaccharide biosynthesis protein
LKHYRDVGSNRNLTADLRRRLKRKGWKVTDIPLGFYHDEYVALNPDLKNGVGFDFIPLFRHYLKYGHDEGRAIGKWQFYIDMKDYCAADSETPSALPVPSKRRGVCLLIHVYYGELLSELVSYANSFGSNLQDVFINVVETSWTPELHGRIRELCPGAFVMVSKNVGRDIGGFLRLLENIDIGKYELFAFMHTKMSPHVAREKAEFWRRKLLNAFAGNATIANRSIEAFRRDPSIGLLGSKEWRNTEIAGNSANFRKMLDLFKIETKYQNVEYLSGTMFLLRPEIVRRIYEVLKDIELESGEGGSLSFNMDGQLAHAIERVIGNVVRQMGYRFEWVDS